MEERRLKALENRMLGRISGPEREEVTGEWRKLHNEELNDLHSPNTVRVIKSRRMKWAQKAEKIQFAPQREHSASLLESRTN
jgi:hypothetical protein